MTSADKPKNQNPNGLGNLGQIAIKPYRQEPIHTTDGGGRDIRIAVNYYGTELDPKPDDKAQLCLCCGSFDAAVNLKPSELRALAAQLCKAATAIEDGQNEFAAFKYQGS